MSILPATYALVCLSLVQTENKTAQGLPSLPVTLEHERAVNVFLRAQEPNVIAGVKSKIDIADEKSLTVFAALRELKNNF